MLVVGAVLVLSLRINALRINALGEALREALRESLIPAHLVGIIPSWLRRGRWRNRLMLACLVSHHVMPIITRVIDSLPTIALRGSGAWRSAESCE